RERRLGRKIGIRLTRAGPLGCRRNENQRRRDALANAPSFIGSKKERPVLDYRPTQRTAELVLIELWFVARNSINGREAIRIRIQRFITKELVEVAVERVGSRFGDDVHHRTGVAP